MSTEAMLSLGGNAFDALDHLQDLFGFSGRMLTSVSTRQLPSHPRIRILDLHRVHLVLHRISMALDHRAPRSQRVA